MTDGSQQVNLRGSLMFKLVKISPIQKKKKNEKLVKISFSKKKKKKVSEDIFKMWILTDLTDKVSPFLMKCLKFNTCIHLKTN